VKVGVLGGTFNPIHCGHLHIARRIQRLFSLTHIHFVVAYIPPHKPLENLISFSHRYAMVSLAVAGIPSFLPSMVELEPETSPFSIDTMAKFAGRVVRSRDALFFIAGGDSLMEVKSWKESETLLSSYNFVFAMRPGTELTRLEDALPKQALSRLMDFRGLKHEVIRRKLARIRAAENRIYIVDVNAPDISASHIRELADSDRRIARLVPRSVYEYIRKLHLYGER